MDPLGFTRHDHRTCIASGVAQAERQCQAAGLQLTPARRRTLEILLSEHRAMGAYEILDQLRQEGLGSQPPVVYRALDFLVAHGFAHRIEKLNAFVACAHSGTTHAPAFLICNTCHHVAEADAEALQEAIDGAATKAGFAVQSAVLEMTGTCRHCAESPKQ